MIAHTALTLGIYVLAAMRLTRLINYDKILDPLHQAVGWRARDFEDRSDAERHRWSKFGVFLHCPWCVGMWISLAGAGVVVWILHRPWWVFLPLGLACSQIIGMARRLSEDDEEITFEAVTE